MQKSMIDKVPKALFCVAAVILMLNGKDSALTVHAKEKEQGPLIQSTTFREEYEGRVAFLGMRTTVLEKPDMNTAYGNVRPAVVRIFAGSFYGSGIIWKLDKEKIILISNRHLLTDWDQHSRVVFYGGATAGGELLMLSDDCDLGFVRVNVSDISYDVLISLREVAQDDTAYLKLKSGDAVFCAGAGDGMELQNLGTEELRTEELRTDRYEGTVADPWRYIEDFRAYMLYCCCYGRPGMSGGGTFDACGNFVGLLTGGTSENETASVPAKTILEEYRDKLEKILR